MLEIAQIYHVLNLELKKKIVKSPEYYGEGSRKQFCFRHLVLVQSSVRTYCEYRLLHHHALCDALLDPELCSHQSTWLNIRNLVGSHRACAFQMCVANVLVKEGYRPCLLKFGDIPDCREIPLY